MLALIIGIFMDTIKVRIVEEKKENKREHLTWFSYDHSCLCPQIYIDPQRVHFI